MTWQSRVCPNLGIIGIFLHNRDRISVSWVYNRVSNRVTGRPKWHMDRVKHGIQSSETITEKYSTEQKF